MRSRRSSTKPSASMPTATCAFGSRSVRRHTSTTVRPRQSSDSQSTSTFSSRVSRRSGRNAYASATASWIREEVDRVLGDRTAARRRQVRAVETRLAVHVRGDEQLADERPIGARCDRHVVAPHELERADRVRSRLLERLVARHGRDAEELDLGARQREQERDRVVVAGIAVDEDRDAHGPRIASTSSAVGSEVCAPVHEAASAPAAQARRSASSHSRPSRRETTRQAVKASPAAVPSTASTEGGAARATSSPSSRSTAPSTPRVTHTRPARSPSASSSSWFTTVSSASGAFSRAGAALRKNRGASSAARATVSAGISCWPSTASASPLARSSGPSSAFAPGATTMVVSPAASTVISAIPVGASFTSQHSSTPASRNPASAAAAFSSRPTAPTIDTLAPSRAAATAWFAPLAPGMRMKRAPLKVSPGRGSRSACTARSRLIEPTTVNRGGAGIRRAYPDVYPRVHRGQKRVVTSREEEKRAANEATFRDANERIRATEQELDPPLERVPYLCECDDVECRGLMRLTGPEYERVRQDGATFAVLPGHSSDGHVIAEPDNYP